MTVTLLHGDCLEVLPTLAAESVDAVVCDPPYGIGFMSGPYWHVPRKSADTTHRLYPKRGGTQQ